MTDVPMETSVTKTSCKAAHTIELIISEVFGSSRTKERLFHSRPRFRENHLFQRATNAGQVTSKTAIESLKA